MATPIDIYSSEWGMSRQNASSILAVAFEDPEMRALHKKTTLQYATVQGDMENSAHMSDSLLTAWRDCFVLAFTFYLTHTCKAEFCRGLSIVNGEWLPPFFQAVESITRKRFSGHSCTSALQGPNVNTSAPNYAIGEQYNIDDYIGLLQANDSVTYGGNTRVGSPDFVEQVPPNGLGLLLAHTSNHCCVDSGTSQGLSRDDENLSVAGYPPAENMLNLLYSAMDGAQAYNCFAFDESHLLVNRGLGSECTTADSMDSGSDEEDGTVTAEDVTATAEDGTMTPIFKGFYESSYSRQVPPSPFDTSIDILGRKWIMYGSPEMMESMMVDDEIPTEDPPRAAQKQRVAAGKKASRAFETKRNERNLVLQEFVPNSVPRFGSNSQITEYGRNANFDNSLAQVYMDADGCMHHQPHMNSRGMTHEIITKGGGETPEIIEIPGGRFTCSLCPKTYSDRGGLRRHFVKHRTGGVYCPFPTKCPSVKRVFSRWDHFRGHIKAHHLDIDLESATMYEIYSKYLHRGEQPMESKLRRTARQPRGKANKSAAAAKSRAPSTPITPESLCGSEDLGSESVGDKRKSEEFEIFSPLGVKSGCRPKMQHFGEVQ